MDMIVHFWGIIFKFKNIFKKTKNEKNLNLRFGKIFLIFFSTKVC